MIVKVTEKDVATRGTVRELKEELEESEVLDMEDVEFITRSSADELLYIQREKDLEFENLQDDVSFVLERVQETVDEKAKEM